MECPHCAATLPDDDIFCEQCGERLSAVEGGCACGAAPDEIDEDGFCGRCGKRVRPRPEDHIEIVISPDFAAVADRGVRHDRNEDRIALRGGTGFPACEDSSEGAQVESLCHQSFVMVACDGVSSSYESELASSAAVEIIAETLERGESMEDAIAQAADRVAKLAPPDSGEAPSTTAVAAVIRDKLATIGWVGDSRAYWIDAQGARRLTSDHSWMNEAVSSGRMTEEEASADPKAHGITRWLGADAGENARPEVIRWEIPGPGAFLLATDGLWNYAPREEMIANLVQGAEGDALDICRKLVEFANAQGGQDNVTAALLRIVD